MIFALRSERPWKYPLLLRKQLANIHWFNSKLHFNFICDAVNTNKACGSKVHAKYIVMHCQLPCHECMMTSSLLLQ